MAKNPTAEPVQQPSRQAGPEHERLRVFLGTWRTEGQTVPDGATPALPIRSSDEYESMPGGFFVVHRWDGHVGDAERARHRDHRLRRVV